MITTLKPIRFLPQLLFLSLAVPGVASADARAEFIQAVTDSIASKCQRRGIPTFEKCVEREALRAAQRAERLATHRAAICPLRYENKSERKTAYAPRVAFAPIDGRSMQGDPIREFTATSEIHEAIDSACSVRQLLADIGEYSYDGNGQPSPAICYVNPAELITAPSYWERKKIVSKYVESCKQYYKNTFFSVTFTEVDKKEKAARIAQENRRKKDAAERQVRLKKEQEELEKKREEQHQIQLAENAKKERRTKEIDAAFSTSGVEQKNRLLWTQGYAGRARFAEWTDSNRVFNEINRAFVEAEARRIGPFVAPQKGEFETTKAYQSRVQVAKRDYQKNAAGMIKKAKADLVRRRQEILNRHFGNPIVRVVEYDADREVFMLRVGSTTAPYEVAAEYKVSISEAREIKKHLKRATPFVLFSYEAGVLKAEILVLAIEQRIDYKGNEILTASVISDSGIPIKFGEATLANWKKVVGAEERRRQDALAKKREDRIRQYGHAGPFLDKGALLCLDFKSLHKAAAIARANNPYVPIPYDCISATPNVQPITNVSHMPGGMARAVLKATGDVIYTLSQYVSS